MHLPVETSHPVPVDLETAERAAEAYERLIVEQLHRLGCTDSGFDLVMLGVGEDGHTASLFPGKPQVFQEDGVVCAVHAAPDGLDRISLTPRAIRCARRIIVQISGPEKARIVDAIFDPGQANHADRYPIHVLWPVLDRVHWFVDRSALSQWRGDLKR